MKHFWKFTGSLFGKLVIARIFGFILSCTILMALSGMVGSVVTQICSVLILIIMVFTTAWEQGSKDANMVDIDQLKLDRWLGLKAGLAASSLDLIAAVLLLLTKAEVVGYGYSVLFGIYNCNYLPFHQALVSTTLTVAEHAWIGYIGSAATVLIAPLCAGFGYRLGLTQLNLSDTLLYTTPESRERHAQKVKAREHKGIFKRNPYR